MSTLTQQQHTRESAPGATEVGEKMTFQVLAKSLLAILVSLISSSAFSQSVEALAAVTPAALEALEQPRRGPARMIVTFRSGFGPSSESQYYLYPSALYRGDDQTSKASLDRRMLQFREAKARLIKQADPKVRIEANYSALASAVVLVDSKEQLLRLAAASSILQIDIENVFWPHLAESKPLIKFPSLFEVPPESVTL